MEIDRKQGSAHLITSVTGELISVFRGLGYTVASGPELETEYYNFTALNIPAGHPARDMQDTFWVRDREGAVMRTHTSPVQVRWMEAHEPPVRIIVPGKVFRNEATDATHEVQFHQLEGLCVTENTTLADMKGVLDTVLSRLFGSGVEVRYRSSFFPFTEPSLEVDMKRPGDDRWIEVLGCGMVHRQVLSRAGVDPYRYRGFAFGMGIDRVAMLRHGVDDVRALYRGDLRLVTQF